jgi:hypothetical protein
VVRRQLAHEAWNLDERDSKRFELIAEGAASAADDCNPVPGRKHVSGQITHVDLSASELVQPRDDVHDID